MSDVEVIHKERAQQGDIFSDIPFLESATEEAGEISVARIFFPWVVILSQECDLEQDMKCRSLGDESESHDKYLLTVLVAPLYVAEHVFAGSHWELLGRKMQRIKDSRTRMNLIIQNEIPRYHYLECGGDSQLASSVVDFKHYFAVSTETMDRWRKQGHYVCSLRPFFRERITQRFADFLSRIGLPEAGS